MSDWDFLYDMRHAGYSPEQIADAAACGYNPWEERIREEWVDSKLEFELETTASNAPAQKPEPFQSREGLPFCPDEHLEILEELIECARRHYENTGRYLQIWGELGEIYAEVKYGLCRHGTHFAGSDGTIDGKLVEVKTISPEKSSDRVIVKSQGNFEQLLIVRISSDFKFQSKIFNRSELKGADGKYLSRRL